MNMSQFAGTSFVTYSDVEAGPLEKIIENVEPGKFNKPLVTFDDGTRMGLNKTNVRTLTKAFGSESDDWIGCPVELYGGVLEYQGRQHNSVLVRAVGEDA